MLGAGAVLAGTVTIGSGTAPTYAVEDLKPTTTVTLPDIVYDTGAGAATYKLTPGVNYRVIFTLPAGMAWSVGAAPTVAAGTGAVGAVTGTCSAISYAGQQANELAYGCSINAAAAEPAEFTLTGGTSTAGSLATAGTEIYLTKVATQSIEGATNWDTVNNTLYAKSGKAIVLTTLDQAGNQGSDTETVTDAEYTAAGLLKPLNGFVKVAAGAAPNDDVLKAVARFEVSNNTGNFVQANGTALFDMTSAGAVGGEYDPANAVTFNVKDSRSFQALASNGLILASSANALATPKPLTVDPAVGATITVDGNDAWFAAQGNSAKFDLTYTASGVASLGTTRELDISGLVDGGGAKVGLSDVNNWWKWDTNGMILKFAAISYKKDTPSWIQLTNYSTQADATFTATCYGKTSAATAEGTPGVVLKNTTKRVELQDVCGTATKAESVEMVFATKAGNVNGAVVRKNASTGDVTYINASAGNQN